MSKKLKNNTESTEDGPLIAGLPITGHPNHPAMSTRIKSYQESKRLKSRQKKMDINEEPSAGFTKKKRDVKESDEDLSAVLRAENICSVKVNPSGLKGLKNQKLGSEGSRELKTRKKKSRVDPRNTIGDVPLDWYTSEEHVGYDKQGRKILKKARMDMIDSFLARTDDPKSWRTISDEVEDEYVEITKGEMKMLQGKDPHAKFNPHLIEGCQIEPAVKEKKLKMKEKKFKIETAVKEKKLKKKENKLEMKMLTNYEVIEGESENFKKNPTMNMLTNDNRLEVINFLKEFYNITPPLKVLLDAACFRYMQMHDMSKESISHLFASIDLEFYTTSHTVEELNHLSGSLSVSTREASECLKARCVNGMLCSNDAECVISLVKNDNQDSYIVATSDEALHAKLYQMNVPLLRCSGGVIAFYWPSQEQRDRQRAGCARQITSTNQLVDTRDSPADVVGRKVVPEGSYEIKKQKTSKGSMAEGLCEIKNRKKKSRGSMAKGSCEIKNRKKSRVDPRNTIGDVPLDWYTYEEHVGYDKQGRKIKKKERMDRIDSFLARTENTKSWRTIIDEVEDEDVEITKKELTTLKGKAPHTEV